MSQHAMDGAYLKLRRAKQHLDAINQVSEDLKLKGPYRIVQGEIGQGRSREHQVRIKQQADFPPDLSLLLGDFCNNLRSVLDYLVWQLWLLRCPTFSEIVYFPICDSSEEFARRAPKNIGPRKINRETMSLSPNQLTLVENAQPYKTAKKTLSILRDVNDCDKHRLIQVIGVVPNSYDIRVEFDQRRAAIQVPQPKIIPLKVHPGTKVKDGTILAKFPTADFSVGTAVRVRTAIVLDYAFEGSKSADGQLIRTSLFGMLDEVTGIVSKFEPEFASSGASQFK